MKLFHHIMCGCETCIHDVTYQEYLNYWHKHCFCVLNEYYESFMMVTNSRVDAENNAFVYCNTVFTDREQPPHVQNMLHFPAWVIYLKKHKMTSLVMCFELLYLKCPGISPFWCINTRWWRYWTYRHPFWSLLKSQHLFVAQVTPTWR